VRAFLKKNGLPKEILLKIKAGRGNKLEMADAFFKLVKQAAPMIKDSHSLIINSTLPYSAAIP
jgi:hypothetical protein